MQHLIASYGYLAIFLLMVAESACIPVPSELTMTFGGALAAGAVAGTHLNLVLVIVAGVAGNVVGSYIAWAVGLYVGQAALRRWGKRLWIREHDIDRATVWFERNGPKAVLLGRLLPVVRTFISLPAGFAGMRPLRFGTYTTIGVIPWTAALAGAGYAVGANWQSISNGFKGPTYIIAAIVVVALAFLIVRHVRRRPAGNHAATGRNPQGRSGRDPYLGSGRDPHARPGRDPHPGSGRDPQAWPGQDPHARPGRDPRSGAGRDPRSDGGWPPLRSGAEKEQ